MVFAYDRGAREEEDDAASDVSTEEFSVGEHVLLDGKTRAKVAYYGQVEFSHDDDWIGLVFEEPVGKHSGQVSGIEYFKCQPLHGLFVRSHRLQRTDSSGHVTARVKSPYRLRPASANRLRSLDELELEEDMFRRAEAMTDPLGFYEARAGTLRSPDPAADQLNNKLERVVDELQDGEAAVNFGGGGGQNSARNLHSSRTPTPTQATGYSVRRMPAKKLPSSVLTKSKPYGITQGYGERD